LQLNSEMQGIKEDHRQMSARLQQEQADAEQIQTALARERVGPSSNSLDCLSYARLMLYGALIV
jgi:hypothetical protein